MLQQSPHIVVIALGVAKLGGVVGGIHAGQSAKRVNTQARVICNRGQPGVKRGVARLGQGVLHKGTVGLGRLGHTQVALAHQGAAQRRKHGLQLGQFASVVGR